MNSPDLLSIVKKAGGAWMNDNCMRLSASLAYYAMISIAPLLVITVGVMSWCFGSERARTQFDQQIHSLVSPQAADAIMDMAQKTHQSKSGILATSISIVILIFGAAGVFGELQDSMNIIFKVKAKPHSGVIDWLRHRFLSISMVFGIAFLLLVSLFVSTVLTAVAHQLAGDTKIVGFLVDIAASLAVLTILFAGIFKFLPDAHVNWKPVWVGAITTAALFTIGKWLLAWYLKSGSTTSAYGAAGSLAALLIWIYYSAQILYFGAELTQVRACVSGAAPAPTERAERAEAPKAPPKPQPRRAAPAVRSPQPASAWRLAVAAGAGFAAGAGTWGVVRRVRGDTPALDPRRLNHLEQRLKSIAVPDKTAKHLSVLERFAAAEERIDKAAGRR